jgi:metal-dependent amidase/aminoacylase/carboxypeptidase family protein
MAAEDFAFYLRRKPGAFFYLGVQAEPGVPYPSLHNSRYDFNDEALEPGMRMLTGLAFGVGS